MGRLNVITTGFNGNGFDWTDRYNLFSGAIGGLFLALSYFGTDQSQVQRYLTAGSIRESRIGLLMNGIVKVPMQFLILLIGALIFAYYQFNPAPLFFNQVPVEQVRQTAFRDSIGRLEQRHMLLQEKKRTVAASLPAAMNANADEQSKKIVDELKSLQGEEEGIRNEVKGVIRTSGVKSEASDTNYVFLRFVMDHLPAGLVGLLIAVIFLAAWGSIAAALNSMASSSMVDLHKTFFSGTSDDEQEYRISRRYTLFWGIFCVAVAELVTGMGSLIEAVNVLGSWFYGVMLGIFLVAFYVKRVGGHAVFRAAILGELLVILLYWKTGLAWLWLNVIGALAVVVMAYLFQLVQDRRGKSGDVPLG
jgi:Na+/proline symporter